MLRSEVFGTHWKYLNCLKKKRRDWATGTNHHITTVLVIILSPPWSSLPSGKHCTSLTAHFSPQPLFQLKFPISKALNSTPALKLVICLPQARHKEFDKVKTFKVRQRHKTAERLEAETHTTSRGQTNEGRYGRMRVRCSSSGSLKKRMKAGLKGEMQSDASGSGHMHKQRSDQSHRCL